MKEKDIDKKLEKIEKNCIETAKKEYEVLKDENDVALENVLNEKSDIYQKELDKKYEIEVNKIVREFNRNVFDYEMAERKRISKFKEALVQNIFNEVVDKFDHFASSDNYKMYLFKNIQNTLSRFNNPQKCTIYITERDFNKFNDEIVKTFNIVTDKIEDSNIGGCIVINKDEKISINNTLKNNIEEKIKEVSF